MEIFHLNTILFSVWVVSTICFRVFFTKPRKKLHLPPSPFALPVIGHLHLLRAAPHLSLHKLSKKYGPLFQINLGSLPCIVVSSVEMAKEILKTQDTSFCNRSATIATRHLTYDLADFAFSPYGAYWKLIKKLCMSELLNGRMLDQLYPIRRAETRRFLQVVHKKAELGEPVDLKSELPRLTNNIILKMAIGKNFADSEVEARQVIKYSKMSSELHRAFNLADYFKFLKKFDLQGFGKRLKEVRDGYDVIWERIIREHQEKRQRDRENQVNGAEVVAKDILDALLDISEDETSEIKLTKENIKGFFMDIVSGGTDTSSVTMEWTMEELMKHPEVLEKARMEIDSVVGLERIATESDISKLPYLQAVVKETLRLHSPATLITREPLEDCTLGGYDIPAKTRILINVWALSRDPEHWENPLEFRPERFLLEDGEGKSQMDVRGTQLHYTPFGSGRRGCPGISLAMHMVQTTVAAMIQCFEWKAVGEVDSSPEKKGDTAVSGDRGGRFICTPLPRLNPFPPLSLY